MSIYCWGNTEHGALGVDCIMQKPVALPHQLSWEAASDVVKIVCGHNHTLFITSDGSVYSNGSNGNGPVGHAMHIKRPRMSPFHIITELKNGPIANVSCGLNHSLALNTWGQIFSWGDNELGQLGLGQTQPNLIQPKIVRKLLTRHIVQVASGNNHCLALTSCGELYAWGSNVYGELGESNDLISRVPVQLKSLSGIPIAFIACGGSHSIAITKSGTVYAWGRNCSGQLGLNDERHRATPTLVKSLRSFVVRYAACGDEFSVFLTKDGGVFTCGNGKAGQLGHGTYTNEMQPRKVVELMGSTVTQIACGKRHTLAFVPVCGRVYSFGVGSYEQLKTILKNNPALPQVVPGPWVPPNDGSIIQTDEGDTAPSFTVKQIFCGGDSSFVTAAPLTANVPPLDYRNYDAKTQMLMFTKEFAEQCVAVPKETMVDMDILSQVETIFRGQACLNGSFLLPADVENVCVGYHNGLNMAEAKIAFEILRQLENLGLKNTLWDCITRQVIAALRAAKADVENLRIYLILPLYHEFSNSNKYADLHTPYACAMRALGEGPLKILSRWWSMLPSDWFENMVLMFKNVVIHIISFNMSAVDSNDNETDELFTTVPYNKHLESALNMMAYFHMINRTQRQDKINCEVFHWPEIVEYVRIDRTYIHWHLQPKRDTFSICNYPFLFDGATKTIILRTDQAQQMLTAMHIASTLQMRQPRNSHQATLAQYLVLNVSRDNLAQDTLQEILKYTQSDLRKPLKIKFYGEEADDAGGVRKEFFMLLIKDLIDPKYGMFKQYEESRTMWFADVTFETEHMYLLIGVICALAIYNFSIINLPFPLALYKKLLNVPVNISDLKELSPSLGKSMEQLLAYEGDDFEEVFYLRFEITRDIFDEVNVTPLKTGGENLAVTQENKKEFVDLYIDFVFNKAVDKHFNAFRNGFLKVCSENLLKIFEPHELMSMIVGNEDYNWELFELNCEYKNGYTSQNETIRIFWKVFHELPLSDKKKFLLFLTGSDRIPIEGMKAINIVIQPTSDDSYLPVAHTCFNLLDLPRYKTTELLKSKLLLALQQTQGFSLV